MILKTHRKADKVILTLQGPLTISRSILIPVEQASADKLTELRYGKDQGTQRDGGEDRTRRVTKVVPLDEALGIDRLPFKMSAQLMLRCAFWAQNQCSYQAAEDVILDVLKMKINDDTIRMVTNTIGKIIFENDCLAAEKAWKQLNECKLEFSYSKPGVLYIESDGAALNTRHLNDEGSSWRENKLGAVFSSDNIKSHKNSKSGQKEHHIEKREYVSYIGDVATFKKHLLNCALKNGYGQYKTTVILSDGASWIANMAKEVFPDAVHILDFFHLCENVYTYAKYKFNFNEVAYVPWAERICDLLKKGKLEEVMTEIKGGPNYDGCVNLEHYLELHKNHINYPEYLEKGFFIGSGAIESGNKVVLQKRLKQAGMRWEVESAQYLLSIKSKVKSGLWATEVVNPVLAHYGVG